MANTKDPLQSTANAEASGIQNNHGVQDRDAQLCVVHAEQVWGHICERGELQLRPYGQSWEENVTQC